MVQATHKMYAIYSRDLRYRKHIWIILHWWRE